MPRERWGEGADAQGQAVNEQEAERKSGVMGGGNYSEGRKPPCETRLWHLKEQRRGFEEEGNNFQKECIAAGPEPGEA